MQKRFFDDFLFYFLRKKFLKKFLEQKLVDFSTNFYAAESARIKELRYFIAFCFTCNFFSDKIFVEQKKEVNKGVETRTKTLSVRLTPTDIEAIEELRKELMEETNLRVTRGDLISYLLKFYRQKKEVKNYV